MKPTRFNCCYTSIIILCCIYQLLQSRIPINNHKGYCIDNCICIRFLLEKNWAWMNWSCLIPYHTLILTTTVLYHFFHFLTNLCKHPCCETTTYFIQFSFTTLLLTKIDNGYNLFNMQLGTVSQKLLANLHSCFHWTRIDIIIITPLHISMNLTILQDIIILTDMP